MRGRRGKGILLAGLLAIALAGAAWVAAHPADLGRLRDVVDGLAAWRADRPATLWLALWALYVAATALSVPVAVWLTLAAGALFGFVGGLALVLTAAPLGATLSFLAARWIARDKVRGWLGPRAARIEEAPTPCSVPLSWLPVASVVSPEPPPQAVRVRAAMATRAAPVRRIFTSIPSKDRPLLQDPAGPLPG